MVSGQAADWVGTPGSKPQQAARLEGLSERIHSRIKPWTITALNRLKEYAQEGIKIGQIQKRYFPDRTYAAIFAQLRKLGFVGQSRCVRYGEEELGLIRNLVADAGLTATQISTAGVLPERSADSIQIQIGRMGLVDSERSESVRRARPWTIEENQKLTRLVGECHFSPKEIFTGGHFPARSGAAIQDRISRLHLADPKRSASARTARSRRLSGELDQYRNFLQQNASTLTIEQIAEQWIRSTQLVRRDLRSLGIGVPPRVPSDASLEHARSSARAAQQKRWAEWKRRRRDLKFRRREEIRVQGVEIEERTCKMCGERWHLTPEFFREKYNLRHGIKGKFFSGSCVLCKP